MAEAIQSHWTPWAGYVANAFRRSPARPLRPVKGGRWMVRKHNNYQLYDGVRRPWRAWTTGSAKRYARYFETQEQAAAWAHGIAQAYAVGDPDHAAIMAQDLARSRAGQKVSYR